MGGFFSIPHGTKSYGTMRNFAYASPCADFRRMEIGMEIHKNLQNIHNIQTNL